MNWLEIGATILTLVSVFLTVHLKKALYPVGLVATALFFWVFWSAKLYASAGLQIYFTAIQVYGWWFWTRGDRGREPPIGDWSWGRVGLVLLAAAVPSVSISWLLARLTNASSPYLDMAIFTLSVLAQFLLDRKQIKHWAVWGAVNLLSIYVYAGQALWWTTALYGLLFVNVFYGAWTWRRARSGQALVAASAG